MFSIRILKFIVISCILMYTACVPQLTTQKTQNKTVPASYHTSQDTANSAKIKWKTFFKDPYLNALIDTALKNNQDLNIMLQEINIARQEVRARKGEYLPFVNVGGGAGVDKVGRYTRTGAFENNTDILPGKKFPEPFTDFMIGAHASWEVDIWRKLRNAKKAAMYRYFATDEGRKFMVTNLISDIANSYYELLALDNQLEILKQNIEIQQNALEIVKLEKEAAKVTELAVRRFEAEVLKNRSRQYEIMQRIIETENRINFLTGRFPQPVSRNSQGFVDLVPDTIFTGIPSQLLENRPDMRQAELELLAAKLDVKTAKANFYPSLRLTAGVGYQAFNPKFLISTPESMLYNLGGELIAPVINRNAIKAYYYSANSRQIKAVYNYEQALLRAHIEVTNQLFNISNLQKSYDLKTLQVQALTRSIDISTILFNSARADYMEVLLTQRDALESKFELIETKKQQMNAMVNIYQALGGGWN
ncbi:MAG: TolC family protein [Cytophagaceae bacterium]|nr:TolC family protein [Cytophagaceae bacterium]